VFGSLAPEPACVPKSRTVSAFGAKANDKLTSPAAAGQPEDQLRAPFEKLLGDVAELANFQPGAVVAVGESSDRELKTRPDYAITVRKALVGFVGLKAPGKGADPRKFKDGTANARGHLRRSLYGALGYEVISSCLNAPTRRKDGHALQSFVPLFLR